MNELEQAQQIIARLQTELGQAHEQIIQLESELRYYRESWWPVLRAELTKPEYADLVEAQDAEEILARLTAPTEPVALDPLPMSVVQAELAGLVMRVALAPFPDDTRNRWGFLVQQLIGILQGVSEVPRSEVESLVNEAIQAGLLPEDYTYGYSRASKLEKLGLMKQVRTIQDVRQAMGW
jgi:hypothetical protein